MQRVGHGKAGLRNVVLIVFHVPRFDSAFVTNNEEEYEQNRHPTRLRHPFAARHENGTCKEIRVQPNDHTKVPQRGCNTGRQPKARQKGERVCPQSSQRPIYHPPNSNQPHPTTKAMKPQHLNTVQTIRKRLAKHLKFFPSFEALETSYQWIINAPQDEWADRTFAAIQAARGKKDPSAVYAWTFQGYPPAQ